MISIDVLIITVAGLERAEVEHWIAQDWIRPESREGIWQFHDIDVARAHLIRQLRHDFGLQEDAMPIILRLLDQLYGERRRLRRLRDVVDQMAPAHLKQAMLDALLSESENDRS